MRLTWNEVRARAADFSREWADAHYEKGETQSFYSDFFAVFGVKRRAVCSPAPLALSARTRFNASRAPSAAPCA